MGSRSVLFSIILFALFAVHIARTEHKRDVIQFIDEEHYQIPPTVGLTEGNIYVFVLISASLYKANPRSVLKYLADFKLANIVLAFEFIRIENIDPHNVHSASISWRNVGRQSTLTAAKAH